MTNLESSYFKNIRASESVYTTLLDNSSNSTNFEFNNNFSSNYSEFIDTKSNVNQIIINILQQETSLVWIIFGTIGNLLSLFVLLRRRMRIHSTFTYLTLLAVCDTFVLYFGLLRDYLVNKYKFDVNGDILCKFHVFSFYFVLHMASWLLVAVNIDRLIAASFLSLSKKWCTPRMALKVSFYLAIFLIVLNSHFIYYVVSSVKPLPNVKNKNTLTSNFNFYLQNNLNSNQLVDNKPTLYNNSSENLIMKKNASQNSVNLNLRRNQMFFLNNPLNNLEDDSLDSDCESKDYILADSFSHFTTLVSSKLTIEDENMTNGPMEEPINPYVYQKCLIKANNPNYSYFFQNIFTWIDASTQVILPFIIMLICNINIIHKVLLTKNKTNGKNLKRLRKIKGMCIMILSVSIIFFVLEAPVLIFICLMQGEYIQPNWPYIELVWTIMNLMMYTNHVINFFSYCMTGTKFRRELLRLLYVHNLLKFVSSYKNINFLTTNVNNTTIPVNTKSYHNSNKNRNLFNSPHLKIEQEINEKDIVNFEVKEPKVNFVVEPILINKLHTNDNKPISLTTCIINKKNLLGESAIRNGKTEKSKINFIIRKSNKDLSSDLNDSSNLNSDYKTSATMGSKKCLDSSNNDEPLINGRKENNDGIEMVKTDKRYSKDDSDIFRSPSASRGSFRSFRSFKLNKKKKR